jgi:hypothetical protein
MSSTDPNLGLNYGWTLGESGWDTGMDANLKRLGAVVGLSVKDRDLTTPPASPANGDRYLVPAAATGVWAGKTNQIAVRIRCLGVPRAQDRLALLHRGRGQALGLQVHRLERRHRHLISHPAVPTRNPPTRRVSHFWRPQ